MPRCVIHRGKLPAHHLRKVVQLLVVVPQLVDDVLEGVFPILAGAAVSSVLTSPHLVCEGGVVTPVEGEVRLDVEGGPEPTLIVLGEALGGCEADSHTTILGDLKTLYLQIDGGRVCDLEQPDDGAVLAHDFISGTRSGGGRLWLPVPANERQKKRNCEKKNNRVVHRLHRSLLPNPCWGEMSRQALGRPTVAWVPATNGWQH